MLEQFCRAIGIGRVLIRVNSTAKRSQGRLALVGRQAPQTSVLPFERGLGSQKYDSKSQLAIRPSLPFFSCQIWQQLLNTFRIYTREISGKYTDSPSNILNFSQFRGFFLKILAKKIINCNDRSEYNFTHTRLWQIQRHVAKQKKKSKICEMLILERRKSRNPKWKKPGKSNGANVCKSCRS